METPKKYCFHLCLGETPAYTWLLRLSFWLVPGTLSLAASFVHVKSFYPEPTVIVVIVIVIIFYLLVPVFRYKFKYYFKWLLIWQNFDFWHTVVSGDSQNMKLRDQRH